VSGPFQGGTEPARVDAVLVSYESRDLVLAALASLREHGGVPLDVVVVDNASTDGTVTAVRDRHPRARLLANPDNRGFAAASNQGWRAGRAPLVLFLNPDAEVTAGAVGVLADVLDARSDAAIVGPRTLSEDGSVQVSTGEDLTIASERRQRRLVRGVRARDPRRLSEADERHSRPHEPDWVSGACLLARRSALEALGGFDEGFFLYEEDADLCRRARAAGWRVLFTPEAVVRHRLGRSMAGAAARARAEYDRSHLRYYSKHNGFLETALLRVWLAATRVASR
jgi:N-acetylglucosaminyl-diphospho-decaprenol L-rhamnosyltransferase